ncbi:MAG: adenylate cyclase, partial [Acetobacteraceae bacterium]|nr:adenylate cyclase [Acetobacteraceae bacterium]
PLVPFVSRTLPATAECATIMCAHLRGYEALVEHRPARQVASLLEEFFTLLIKAVLQHGGHVFDIADAHLVAGFGVGDYRHTQIHEAIAAARLIQHRCTEIRASWQQEHAIAASIGLGIDRGDVVVEAFGLPEQPTLTLVGYPAHVAAQLCERARAGEILISDAVYLPHACATAAAKSTRSLPFVLIPPLQLRGCRSPFNAWCAAVPERIHCGLMGEPVISTTQRCHRYGTSATNHREERL